MKERYLYEHLDNQDVLVEQAKHAVPHYDVRAMDAYAKSKGKTMADLTEDERRPFITGYVNQYTGRKKISQAI